MHLNIDGNIVLQIECIRQDDGSKIMVEFNNFTMLKEAYDNIRYEFNEYQVRNQIEYYPIISLGDQTSSSDIEGNYIFINPSYLKDMNTKIQERRLYKRYHDLLYSGFKTLDMDKHYDCSRKYKSGNWFPYGIEYDYDNYVTKETCQHTIDKPHTNLNGVYDQDMKKNERQIILCNRPKVEDCFVTTYEKYNSRTRTFETTYENCEGFCFLTGFTLNYTTTIKFKSMKHYMSFLDNKRKIFKQKKHKLGAAGNIAHFKKLVSQFIAINYDLYIGCDNNPLPEHTLKKLESDNLKFKMIWNSI